MFRGYALHIALVGLDNVDIDSRCSTERTVFVSQFSHLLLGEFQNRFQLSSLGFCVWRCLLIHKVLPFTSLMSVFLLYFIKDITPKKVHWGIHRSQYHSRRQPKKRDETKPNCLISNYGPHDPQQPYWECKYLTNYISEQTSLSFIKDHIISKKYQTNRDHHHCCGDDPW